MPEPVTASDGEPSTEGFVLDPTLAGISTSREPTPTLPSPISVPSVTSVAPSTTRTAVSSSTSATILSESAVPAASPPQAENGEFFLL
jgi:hypothetical protein